MKTVSITRRVFLVAQPDSEVFVTELQYLCIRGRCTVLTPQQGDPAKKVKITRKTGLTALPGSLVNVSDNQYKRIKGACSDAYKVSYKYTGTVPSGAPAVPAAAYYTAGTTVTVAAAPTFDGYTFSGWSEAGTFTMPAEDVEITGSWTEAPKYTVQYQYEYVGAEPPWWTPEPPQSSMHEPGEMVTPASLPEDFDVFFAPSEWYLGETPLDGEFEMPEQDVTLTGYFTFKVSVKYRWNTELQFPTADAADLLPQTQQYPAYSEVEVAEEPDLSGTQFEGWTFNGWYDPDGEQRTYPDKVTIGNDEEFTFDGELRLDANAAIYYDWNNWNDFRQYEDEARALLPAMTTGEARSQTTVAAAPNLAGTPLEGWTFSGWYTASGAQPLLYPDTINYGDPEDITRLFGTLTPPGN